MMMADNLGLMLTPDLIMEIGRSKDRRIGVGAKGEKARFRRIASRAEKFGIGELIVFEDPDELAEALRDGGIDAAVRGNLDSTAAMRAVKNAFSVRKILRMALLKPVGGPLFFFAPVGVDEGWSVEEKIELIELGGKLMTRLGVEPKVGILSGGRHGDRGRHPVVDRTLSDAEEIVRRAGELGYDVKDCEILIENAIEDRNMIIAPDGISGNLIFRTLHFLGGGKALGAPILNIDRVFVDTSRAKRSYLDSIALASALTGRGKK